jgi:hypothetical protein
VWLWERESALAAARADNLGRPIGYGLSAALLGVLCLGLTDLISIRHWWISGLLLLPALVALEYRITVRDWRWLLPQLWPGS